MSPQVSEPTVTVLDPRRRPQPVSVTVQFVEGPRYKVRDIRWHGNNAVSIDQIVAISELQPGDILDMSKGRETLEAMLRLYHSIGYRDVAITDQPQMADDGVEEVTLHFYVSEVLTLPSARVPDHGHFERNPDVTPIISRLYDCAAWNLISRW